MNGEIAQVMVSDHTPSIAQPSRRQLLATGVLLGVSGLAGCSGEARSDSADCSTTAVDHGTGELLQQATAMANDGAVVLMVSLEDPAADLAVESILLRDSDGDLQAEIPTTDAREYRQTIGTRPQHGRIELIAVDDQREEVDSLTIEFHCGRE